MQVAVIKAKLHDEVGLPAGKQKLQQDVRYNISLLPII